MKRGKTKTSIKSTTSQPSYYHKSVFDLYIANSTIANAGLGVFTRELIHKNTVIDEYYGDVYEISHSPSRYYFEIEQGVGIDAFNLPRCYMAMINDAYGSNYTVNCEFVIDKSARRVFIKASTEIHPEQELFISYGDQYWSIY